MAEGEPRLARAYLCVFNKRNGPKALPLGPCICQTLMRIYELKALFRNRRYHRLLAIVKRSSKATPLRPNKALDFLVGKQLVAIVSLSRFGALFVNCLVSTLAHRLPYGPPLYSFLIPSSRDSASCGLPCGIGTVWGGSPGGEVGLVG